MKTNGPGVRGPGEPWDASTHVGEPILIRVQMHRINHFKLLWFLQETSANSRGTDRSCEVLQPMTDLSALLVQKEPGWTVCTREELWPVLKAR